MLNKDTSNLVNIKFIDANGEEYKIQVHEGISILEAAHSNAIPLEGACEGALACSTCHIILESNYFNKLPHATEDEDDMLDMAFGLTATSRLGCQIIITKDAEGQTFKIPSATRNESAHSVKK